MGVVRISAQSEMHIARIAELRGWNQLTLEEEVSRCIGIAWLTVERRVMATRKDDSGKAPNTGNNSQTKRDDKATSDGKPVDPNRPHVDR